MGRVRTGQLAWTNIDGLHRIVLNDLLSWSASTISTREGGMSCVMVPEAAITPVASFMS